MLTVKSVTEDIMKYIAIYDDLRKKIANNFNENDIDNAFINIERLMKLDEIIKSLENLQVCK